MSRIFLRKGYFLLLIFGCPTLWLIGCATIMHGTNQPIGFSSTPTGASVYVDDEIKGNTPLVVKLSRGDTHLITIEMPKYEPFEMNITKHVSGWVWGNLVFGGLLGLVVDAATGGLYELSPEQIQATLVKSNVGFLYKKDSIYVAVVLNSDPSWHKIGTLKPIIE